MGRGDYHRAIDLSLQALESDSIHLGVNSKVYAVVLDNLAQSYAATLPTDDITRLKEKFESCKMLTVGQDKLCYAIKTRKYGSRRGVIYNHAKHLNNPIVS